MGKAPQRAAPQMNQTFTPTAETVAAERAAEAAAAATEQAAGNDAPARARQRLTFGATPLKLEAPKREGFVRRWVNDEPGRIELFKQRGYELVLDPRTQQPMTSIVGVNKRGGELAAFLMETPEEYYQEDTELKDRPLKQFDSELKRGASGGKEPGDDGRYVPKDAHGRPIISVKNR